MSKSAVTILCIVSMLAIAGLALSSNTANSGAAMTQTKYFNDMVAFPLDPQIQCSFDDHKGLMQWQIKNTLDSPIHLEDAKYGEIHRKTYVVMIINGREINPALNCKAMTIKPGEDINCFLQFNPNELKTGIYRTYHNYDWLRTYAGEPAKDVLRVRLTHKGAKFRTNQKFDCTQE